MCIDWVGVFLYYCICYYYNYVYCMYIVNILFVKCLVSMYMFMCILYMCLYGYVFNNFCRIFCYDVLWYFVIFEIKKNIVYFDFLFF